MNRVTKNVPIGVVFLEWFCSKIDRVTVHRAGVFILTFIAYTCYHMTRKPISVVKDILNQDWSPFDTVNGSVLLGALDSAFLFSYAAAMFLSGFIAERVNLRYFLAIGMILSGISCYLFGIAKTYSIHSMTYFVIVQILSGIFQTSGWPGVVTAVGNWFGKGKRGVIFGIWNSHTSLGNILGSLLAAKYVESDWSLSFIVPGAIMGILGFIIFLFLVPSPDDIDCFVSQPNSYKKYESNCASEDGDELSQTENSRLSYHEPCHSADADLYSVQSEVSPMLAENNSSKETVNDKAISFRRAIRIPGVIEYSFALFFAKFVCYTFLFWLPLYISSSTTYGAKNSAKLSTVFDIGGVVGAIVAGLLSDYSKMSAVTCIVMATLSAPALFFYNYIGEINLAVNIVMLFITGALTNGPYALITTAVAADLGTHPSLGENSKALATVTSIIDGTGSIGAAVGPLLAGLITRYGNWQDVFYMLISADVLTLCLLLRLGCKEIKTFTQRTEAV